MKGVRRPDLLPIFLACLQALKRAGCHTAAIELDRRVTERTMRRAAKRAAYGIETGQPASGEALAAVVKLAEKLEMTGVKAAAARERKRVRARRMVAKE